MIVYTVLQLALSTLRLNKCLIMMNMHTKEQNNYNMLITCSHCECVEYKDNGFEGYVSEIEIYDLKLPSQKEVACK